MHRVVALDGPVASGKSTIGRRAAARFGLAFLDTGLLYRATGARVLDAGGNPDDAELASRIAADLGREDLARDDLQTQAVADAASRVSALPPVRDALLAYQRRFADQPEGALLVGRDIGTVVCPNAKPKIFLTASAEARAQRRFQELRSAGVDVIYADVLQQVRARDARDTTRKLAPLQPAADAILLDTTAMDLEAAVSAVCAAIDAVKLPGID
ncbi:MAG: (d)CMP kinase [Geminicoccaceae bacterium]